MKIKAIYRKNLKMSEGKVASQIAHAVIGLQATDALMTIVVLKVSDKKFNELINEKNCYIHTDNGTTEVESGERTCAAWFEL